MLKRVDTSGAHSFLQRSGPDLSYGDAHTLVHALIRRGDWFGEHKLWCYQHTSTSGGAKCAVGCVRASPLMAALQHRCLSVAEVLCRLPAGSAGGWDLPRVAMHENGRALAEAFQVLATVYADAESLATYRAAGLLYRPYDPLAPLAAATASAAAGSADADPRGTEAPCDDADWRWTDVPTVTLLLARAVAALGVWRVSMSGSHVPVPVLVVQNGGHTWDAAHVAAAVCPAAVDCLVSAGGVTGGGVRAGDVCLRRTAMCSADTITAAARDGMPCVSIRLNVVQCMQYRAQAAPSYEAAAQLLCAAEREHTQYRAELPVLIAEAGVHVTAVRDICIAYALQPQLPGAAGVSAGAALDATTMPFAVLPAAQLLDVELSALNARIAAPEERTRNAYIAEVERTGPRAQVLTTHRATAVRVFDAVRAMGFTDRFAMRCFDVQQMFAAESPPKLALQHHVMLHFLLTGRLPPYPMPSAAVDEALVPNAAAQRLELLLTDVEAAKQQSPAIDTDASRLAVLRETLHGFCHTLHLYRADGHALVRAWLRHGLLTPHTLNSTEFDSEPATQPKRTRRVTLLHCALTVPQYHALLVPLLELPPCCGLNADAAHAYPSVGPNVVWFAAQALAQPPQVASDDFGRRYRTTAMQTPGDEVIEAVRAAQVAAELKRVKALTPRPFDVRAPAAAIDPIDARFGARRQAAEQAVRAVRAAAAGHHDEAAHAAAAAALHPLPFEPVPLNRCAVWILQRASPWALNGRGGMTTSVVRQLAAQGDPNAIALGLALHGGSGTGDIRLDERGAMLPGVGFRVDDANALQTAQCVFKTARYDHDRRFGRSRQRVPNDACVQVLARAHTEFGAFCTALPDALAQALPSLCVSAGAAVGANPVIALISEFVCCPLQPDAPLDAADD